MHGHTTMIIAESAKKARIIQIRHLTCTGSLGPLVGSQQSQKRPGVLQVGRTDMQWDRSSLTVEPANKPRVSSHEGK